MENEKITFYPDVEIRMIPGKNHGEIRTTIRKQDTTGTWRRRTVSSHISVSKDVSYDRGDLARFNRKVYQATEFDQFGSDDPVCELSQSKEKLIQVPEKNRLAEWDEAQKLPVTVGEQEVGPFEIAQGTPKEMTMAVSISATAHPEAEEKPKKSKKGKEA